MIAGFLSKFGKIGVILGFIAGNVILSYVSTGGAAEVIYLKEIVIASLGLLLVPKKIQINVEDFFGKELYLPVGMTYGLEKAEEETIDKLNTVSDTISQMARNYKEESQNEIKEVNSKDMFIEALKDRLYTIEENILYDDLKDEEGQLVSEIYDVLDEHGNIIKDDIVKILEKNNEYVLGFEDFDTNMKIENDINKVCALCFETYKISRVNNIWNKKMKENKKVISSQLGGVSRAISDVAKAIHKNSKDEFEDEKKDIKMRCRQRNIELVNINIRKSKNGRYIVEVYSAPCKDEEECRTYEIQNILQDVLETSIIMQKDECGIGSDKKVCRQLYVSKDKFNIQIGIAHDKKKGTTVSGDSSVQTRLDDGKYLVAISDGMGSGQNARKASKTAVSMLSRMLSSGFDKDTSLELINSSMYVSSKEDSYATLDVAILDLYSGNMEFMKNGACPTFIKNKKNVNVVKSVSLPTGILDEVDLVVYDRDLNDGDIIVMCTDGILEANEKYENKEVWVKNLLEEIDTDNVQRIADILLSQAIAYGLGSPKDDMTVIAIKVKKG